MNRGMTFREWISTEAGRNYWKQTLIKYPKLLEQRKRACEEKREKYENFFDSEDSEGSKDCDLFARLLGSSEIEFKIIQEIMK